MAKNKGKDDKNKDEFLLRFKDDKGQEEYGQVQLKFRHGRYCEAMCADNVKGYCRVRGKEAQNSIAPGDIILIDLRDGGKKAKRYHHVILRYMPDKARLLQGYGELSNHIVLDDNEDVHGVDQDELDHRIDFRDEL